MSVQPLQPELGTPDGDVLAAQAGDSGALERLLHAHLPLVRGVAARALRSDGDLSALDDVVQEVMVRAVSNLESLRDPSCLRSWLVAITMRQVRDLRRGRRQAALRLVPLDDALQLRDPGADPRETGEVRATAAQQVREVASAVALLSAKDRAVLREWSHERLGVIDRTELARRLEITPGHAAVRVLRARARLDDARRVIRAGRRHACLTLHAILSQPGAPVLVRARRHVLACPGCGLDDGEEPMPAELLLAARLVQRALAGEPAQPRPKQVMPAVASRVSSSRSARAAASAAAGPRPARR